MYFGTLPNFWITWLAVLPASNPTGQKMIYACNAKFIIAKIAGLDSLARANVFINFTGMTNRIRPQLMRVGPKKKRRRPNAEFCES